MGTLSAKVDEFRDQAAACLDGARKTADLKSKLELLGIAVAWLDLADLLEGSALYQQHDRAATSSAKGTG